jgi:glycosyltransferase involved in cell wall biosynthesis
MKIIYDPQIFALQQFGGISRYICALAERLADRPDLLVKIIAPLHINHYLRVLKCSRSSLVRGAYIPLPPKLRGSFATISNLLFPMLISGARPSIVHETYYSATKTYHGASARVITVYDLIHEKFPQSFSPHDPMRYNRSKAIQRADHVICISERTRRDLVELYDVPDSKITVTYLGYDNLPTSDIDAPSLVGAKPYILYVGSRHGYKNFDGLIKAYASSAVLKANTRIVCFGGGELSSEEKTLIAKHNLSESDVLQVGGDDIRLAILYKGANLFVYPSKYEGFGIPPLEAMSLKCPVVCSNSSSIPEVVGSAGIYFDPNDIDSMSEAMESVLQSPLLRSQLIAKGLERIRLFSWERCADETLTIYRMLAT